MARANRDEDGPVSESGTVVVACKLPNGLVLQLYRMEDADIAVNGGLTRPSKKAVKTDDPPITLNKARVQFGEIPEYKIIAGFSLTENVPANFWNKWLEQNSDSDLVRNKLIFAFEKADRVAAVAKELRSVRSGMEPVLATGDPRMPKDVRLADRTNKDLQPV